MSTPNQSGYQGSMTPTAASGEYNTIAFLIRSILSKANFSTLVQVYACTNDGGLSPVGTVDVQPLVDQVDGLGNAVPHAIIYGLPYARIQGGTNALIMDPQPGDIGMAIFADRDISGVKASKGRTVPASGRRNSMSDGVYIGGMLNGNPTQYVQFNTAGITIHSPADVSITAGGNATITATGNATVQAANAVVQATSIVLKNSGAALKKLLNSAFSTWAAGHTHSGVATGSGTSGVPTTLPDSTMQTSIVEAE